MELLGYFAAVFLNKASSLSLTKLYLWRSTLSRLWFPSVYLSPYMFLAASVNSYSSFDLPVWLLQACGVVRSTAKQWVHRASHKDQSSLTGGKKRKNILTPAFNWSRIVQQQHSGIWMKLLNFCFWRDGRNILLTGRSGNTGEDKTQPHNITQKCFFLFLLQMVTLQKPIVKYREDHSS